MITSSKSSPSRAGALSASMTQLPPSPELTPGTMPLSGLHVPDFSMDSSSAPGGMASSTLHVSTTPSTIIPRLRTVARYNKFRPQALACSSVLTSCSGDDGGKDPTLTSKSEPGPSSLGAVAGPQGVALFQLSRPHVPLLILSHAINSTPRNSISSLAFEPKSNQSNAATSHSLYLAATRGSGVLIWDASGHSPTPLIGRLGMDHAPSSDLDDGGHITSISWKPSTAMPLLATTTASAVSLWDLRSATTASFKPAVQFAAVRKATATQMAGGSTPLVQVACASDSEQCATIDSSGVVRVYDIRMTDRARHGSPVSTFEAHDTAGVGISYFGGSTSTTMPTSSSSSVDSDTLVSSSRWLTWGVDAPMSSAIVKIWTKDSPSQQSTAGSDEFGDYRLTAQCVRPNLACARVCAAPVENSFLAVGHLPPRTSNTEQPGWWAELFTLDETTPGTSTSLSPALSGRSFGLSKIAGFQGGTATSSVDQTALSTVLGAQADIGSLQAAELALSSMRDKGDSDSDDVELLMCCLSNTGVITTHVLPEALPKTAIPKMTPTTTKESPRRVGSRGNLVRMAFPPTNQTRIYPDEREGSTLKDAANQWGMANWRPGGADGLTPLAEQNAPSPHLSSSGDPLVPPSPLRNSAVGGLTPFNMDVPVAYFASVTAGSQTPMNVGIQDIATGGVVSNTGVAVVEEVDPVAVDVRESVSLLNNVETERVPCPRLCGAVFGRGNGGLVAFHNGEVKKMWNWYQRTDAMRQSNEPGGKNDPSPAEPGSRIAQPGSRTVASASLLGQAERSQKPIPVIASTGPRTLKDLVNMVTKAKEDQWGDADGTENSDSDSALSAGDNFFEDESSDSNSSSDSDEDGMSTPAEELYKRYYGGRAWKGSIGKAEMSSESFIRTPTSPDTTEKGTPKDGNFEGISDMLAPVVRLSHTYDRDMLSQQNISLAMGWELGAWEGEKMTATPNPEDIDIEETKGESPAMKGSVRRGLPHYRYLGNTPTPVQSTRKKLPRTLSDGELAAHAHQARAREKAANAIRGATTASGKSLTLDEPIVRGGDYNVRPNIEESMTFLKKLFTHQQTSSGTGISALNSQPDMADSLRSSSSSTISPRRRVSTVTQGTVQVVAVELGVFTLRTPKESLKAGRVSELEGVKKLCLHNAGICADLGESEKEGVWRLLAQTVDRLIEAGGKQSFNGWGGNGGGALGVGLISNLFKYYEGRGDVQMLATMLCVLSGGQRRAADPLQHSKHQQQPLHPGESFYEVGPCLLPPDKDEKYDHYIRRYSDLLYAWGLLSLRAELNKHLVRPSTTVNNSVAPGGMASRQSSSDSLMGVEELMAPEPPPTAVVVASRLSPGLVVAIQCPKCGEDVDPNSNVCQSCQDFAFRCSICDNAVRGLFTVCDICHHGGHVSHMTAWFAKHVECPTGCGCNCTLKPLLTTPGEQVTTAPVMAEQALLPGV